MGEVLDNVGHRGLHYHQDSGSSVFRSTLLRVSVESYPPCKGGCCSSGLYLYEHKTILKRRASLIQTIRQKSLTSHIKAMKITSLPEPIPVMRKLGQGQSLSTQDVGWRVWRQPALVGGTTLCSLPET